MENDECYILGVDWWLSVLNYRESVKRLLIFKLGLYSHPLCITEANGGILAGTRKQHETAGAAIYKNTL
jgi:hypothetical protein